MVQSVKSINREKSERMSIYFFERGIEYYIAGRFSFFTRTWSVTGNLFHHAIEMFMKGYLSKDLSTDKLKKAISHNLRRAWQEFRARVSDQSLDDFNEAIAKLHKWEAIRYPDKMLEANMTMLFTPKSPEGEAFFYDEKGLPKPAQTYIVNVEEIDRLVTVILEKSNFNPGFFLGRYPADALEYLCRANESSLITEAVKKVQKERGLD